MILADSGVLFLKSAKKGIERILHEIWKAAFLAEVHACGGRAILGKGVRFCHRTRFKGRGTVVLKDGVVLGFFLAGAQNAPILLEPREKDSAIVIGEKSHLVNGTEIIAVKSVEIGDHCKIGQGTVIIDSDFHGVMPDDRNSPGKTLPVRIGANVWLGNEVMVLKGVSIGRDAVVGARTLVSGDIKDGDVAVGASMRIVKSVLGKECD